MSVETAKSLDALADGVEASFRQRFDSDPACVAAAPGRVNLIGEHTDYNDGFVLPMAIERQTVVAASRSKSETVRLYSVTMDQQVDLPVVGGLEGLASWARYVRGVIQVYSDAGIAVPGFDGVIDSTVPLGGGLSSSAALEVSLALTIEKLAGVSLPGAERALLCQKAEHLAGVPCGIMDQFASALGEADHLMLLDCRSQQPKMAPLSDPKVAVLIINSNVKHELTGGEYAERRQQCEDAAAALGVPALRDATMADLAAAGDRIAELPKKRARHIIGENDRTVRAADALAASDWVTVGELMYASHAAMRDDFEITIPEIDQLVEFALELGPNAGVIGSRMTGGGFGGCTVSLVESDQAEAIAATITERYQAATGVEPTCFTTRPAQGGRILKG